MLKLSKELYLQKFNLVSEFSDEKATFHYSDKVFTIHAGTANSYIVIKEDKDLGEEPFTFTVDSETFTHIHRILKSGDINLAVKDKGLSLQAKSFENTYHLLSSDTSNVSFGGYEPSFVINRGEFEEALTLSEHGLKDSIKLNKVYTGFTFAVSPEYVRLFTLHTKELIRYTFKSVEIFAENELLPFCLPQTITPIVKNITDDKIKVSTKGKKVLLETESGISIVLGLLIGEFPKFQDVSKLMDDTESQPEPVVFDTKQLKEAIDSVFYFTEKSKLHAITLNFNDKNAIINVKGSKGNSTTTVTAQYPEGHAEVFLQATIVRNLLMKVATETTTFRIDTKLGRLYYSQGNLDVILVLLRKT